MIGELGEREAKELLSAQNLGRLGCCLHNEPYVIPVYFLFEGDAVYIHSLPGRKIEILRENPRACLQVDAIKDDYHWRSVIAYGNYEEIENPEEHDRWLTKLYQKLPHLSPVESMMTPDTPECIVFRLKLTEVTGLYEKWT